MATCFTKAGLAGTAFLVATCAQAATTIDLRPDEPSSKDVFVYEFGVPGVFGIPTPARTTNLDTVTLNAIPGAVPFGNFLGSANTNPLTGANGEVRAHDTKTLIEFDLSFLALTAAKVTHASINLFALPGLPPFANPTAATPVTTELRAVTQPWSETGVTWETQPAVAGAVTSSAQQTGVSQWVTFDVTTLVRGWLANPSSNHGVQLSQPDIVMAGDQAVASLYASSASADASLRPYLSVTAVPEPSTYALFAAGLGMVVLARRRRA